MDTLQSTVSLVVKADISSFCEINAYFTQRYRRLVINTYLMWRIGTNCSFTKLCCSWDFNLILFLVSFFLDAGRSNQLNLTWIYEWMSGPSYYKWPVQSRADFSKVLCSGCFGKSFFSTYLLYYALGKRFFVFMGLTSAPEHRSPWAEGGEAVSMTCKSCRRMSWSVRGSTSS